MILESGNLEFSYGLTLGAGPLTVKGGSVSLSGGTGGSSVLLESDLRFTGGGTISGVIASAVAGTGLDLRLGGATYST